MSGLRLSHLLMESKWRWCWPDMSVLSIWWDHSHHPQYPSGLKTQIKFIHTFMYCHRLSIQNLCSNLKFYLWTIILAWSETQPVNQTPIPLHPMPIQYSASYDTDVCDTYVSHMYAWIWIPDEYTLSTFY